MGASKDLYLNPREIVAQEIYQGTVTSHWSVTATGSLHQEQQLSRSSWRQAFVAAFLPEGFPASTPPDYLAFQVWDSIQALSSYIRGMLSSQAILKGVGVGQQAATPLSAVFQFFLRDLTGMLGGMLFAFWQGSGLDMYAKQWRLFADILNNIGYTLEMISPIFPKYFLFLACLGSLARAVTGVAGGATRAALTQHFAIKGNAADISAKEATQETATTLVGMLLGMLLTKSASEAPFFATLAFGLLTLLHVMANIQAMRSLQLQSINPYRLRKLLEAFFNQAPIPSPAQMAAQDALLPPVIMEAWRSWFLSPYRRPILKVHLGVPLHSLDQNLAAKLHKDHRYILGVEAGVCKVVLRDDAGPMDMLNATFEAYARSQIAPSRMPSSQSQVSEDHPTWNKDIFQGFCSQLSAAGWSLEKTILAQSQWRAAWGTSMRSGHED
ncbi:hypothetical protein WJX84_006945 [Apatococcus fuscideae]|uniref:Uncharacterized protein n=1 Tax=Apatococcus fuscideae TaxID=2026836 RepID=A0AAW1STS2_9CHLO